MGSTKHGKMRMHTRARMHVTRTYLMTKRHTQLEPVCGQESPLLALAHVHRQTLIHTNAHPLILWQDADRRAYPHECARACRQHTHTQTRTLTHIHKHTNTHIYRHTGTHIHAHTYTRTRALTYLHTHTHTLSTCRLSCSTLCCYCCLGLLCTRASPSFLSCPSCCAQKCTPFSFWQVNSKTCQVGIL